MLLRAIVARRPGSGVAADADDATVDAAQDRLIGACQRLVDPAQMGTLFKVLCIAGKGCGTPPAFESVAKDKAQAQTQNKESTPLTL
jgi:hypothetical protein